MPVIFLTIVATLSLIALCAVPSEAASYAPKKAPLTTRWAADVTPETVHREYPRPMMTRPDWKSLNGMWTVALQGESGEMDAPQPILVPFPIESALSGVMQRAERATYRRTFEVPEGWEGRRIRLNFEAVDWEATVSVNGKTLGAHRGGFDPFSFDITDALNDGGPQTLEVAVYDPTDAGDQARGKQHRRSHEVWYTPVTGIWYSVWLEPVPEAHIADIISTPDVDAGALRLTVPAENAEGLEVRAAAYDGNRKVGEVSGAPGEELALRVPNATLWTPENPHLYRLKVSLRRAGKAVDAVDSYFGMRKISLGKDANGITRLMLNGKYVFQVGPLDQGYWPDGLFTPPTEEAMKYDIKAAKGLGFNMIRKHMKVEPRRWYYWADKIGMLVWQDMPGANNGSDAGKEQFEVELRRMIENLRSHPSIIMWVPFNEGWGQYDTERITAMVEDIDPSRLVDNASGWVDKKVGHVRDTHHYPEPIAEAPEENRASVVGEFGGWGLDLPGYIWKEGSWGYRFVPNSEALAAAYERVFRRIWEQEKDPGISAAVYTQITDVEIETNGLLTYDRARLKAPKARIVAANTNRMPPLPTYIPVVPTSQKEPVTWRYTTERPDDKWMKPEFNDSGWKEGPAGFGRTGTPNTKIQTEWTTSDIWLRRTFTLGPTENTKDLYLSIHHDEDAEIYINDVLAARLSGYVTEYEQFPISEAARATLKPGENTIAIHVHNAEGGQFIDAGIVRRK